MTELLELQKVDILAFLLAGVCHDLGHDGYTNGYHINAMSERTIRYSDVSVQENYHAAETFFIMQRHNFLEKMSSEQFKTVRKRVIGCILATDMAKHAADLSQLKSLVEAKQIKGGHNSELVLNKENDAALFKSQQFILETALHSCDLS
jgi:high affinity cGMP-specific 3',5'-cyclic phosphodiesterase 9